MLQEFTFHSKKSEDGILLKQLCLGYQDFITIAIDDDVVVVISVRDEVIIILLQKGLRTYDA